MGIEKVKVFTWRTTSMLVFTGAKSPMHEHVTTQFSLAVDGDSRARLEGGEWASAPGILIPQGMPHEYDATQGLHLVLWIEPESRAGRAIRQRYPEDRLHLFSEEDVAGLREQIRPVFDADFGPKDATRLRNMVLEKLAGEYPQPEGRIDPRVRKAIDVMYEHRDEDLSVGELAERIGLSESHLSHLFSEQIGVPVSRYRMWLRAVEASRQLTGGKSITEVAHAAGFSDGAHLSRTFKRLFGQTPSAALEGAMEVYAIDEDD